MNDNTVIDFDADGLSAIADVADFLVNNAPDLMEKFKPTVTHFLANEYLFTGPFLVAFNAAFDEFIVGLVREEVASHFTTLNPEQIMMLTNKEVISLIATPTFFDKENYK